MKHLFISLVILSLLSVSLFALDQCPNFQTEKKVEFEKCRMVVNTSPVSGYAYSVSILKTENNYLVYFNDSLERPLILIADGEWRQINDYNDHRTRMSDCYDKKLSQTENFYVNETKRYFRRYYSLNSKNQLVIEEDYGKINPKGNELEVNGKIDVVCELKEQEK